MSFDVDTSQLPEEAKALVEQSMAASGTLAFQTDPQTAEFTVDASMAGETMNMAMKLVGDKAWLQFMDEWYEMPAEMQQMLGQSAGQEAQVMELEKLFSELAIDPATWMRDLRLVGEETVDGTPCYHLAASPDLTKMMADVVKLMQSGKITGLMNSAASAGDATGASTASGIALPSAQALEEMGTQMQSMFQNLTADLWIAKDDLMIRKMEMGARMTPPAGEDVQGLNAVVISAVITLQGINGSVTVEAPSSAKPWTELQQAMEQNPGMFMMPFSGAL